MTASTRLLAEFLRARRAQVSPAAAGLPVGGRRRTPGLRREEVAQLAGLSATWYTWIEQGRDVAASPAALARLAEALALGRAERAYLFELAGRRDPAAPTASADAAPASLVAAVTAFPGPAYLIDRGWDVVAANPAAHRLFGPWLSAACTPATKAPATSTATAKAVEATRPPEVPPAETTPAPNLLRFIFLDPAARRLVAGWEERARRVIAELRADLGHGPEDPRLGGLIEELATASPDFARWWREQAVLGRDGGRRSFDHPDDGPVAYDQLTLASDAAPGFRLVLLVGPAAAA